MEKLLKFLGLTIGVGGLLLVVSIWNIRPQFAISKILQQQEMMQ